MDDGMLTCLSTGVGIPMPCCRKMSGARIPPGRGDTSLSSRGALLTWGGEMSGYGVPNQFQQELTAINAIKRIL